MYQKITKLLNNRYFQSNLPLIILITLGKAFSFIWKTILLKENIELVGKIEVFLTTLGLVTAITTLGFPATFARFSLRNKDKTAAYQSLALNETKKIFLKTIIAIFLVLIFFKEFYQKIFIIPIFIFLFILFLNLIQEFFLVFLNITRNFNRYGIAKFILQPGLRLIFIVFYTLGLFNKNILFNHIFIAIILSSIITLYFLSRTNYFQIKKATLSQKESKSFLSYANSLSGSFITFMIYGAIDIYLIEYFSGNFLVGIYSAIFMLINILDLLFNPFLQTFQVHLAEKNGLQEKINFTRKNIISLALFSLLSGLFISILGPIFLTSFFKINNYLLSITIFVIAKIIHSTFVLINRHLLDFEGEEKFTFKTMTISLIIKIILGIIFINLFGLVGLAVSQLVTEIIHYQLLKIKINQLTN